MIIKTNPDKNKSRSLLKMADITLNRLNETDKLKYPSNTLEDYYDIIHKLMEALTLSDGVKIKGEGAHLELIDYICKKHGFGQREFLQQLRTYRNRISYEGFSVKREYVERNEVRINEIIERLSILVRKKL